MFHIRQKGSSVTRELLGGTTTFMAMSYIIFVQPIFLAQAGMDANGVMIATCLASAAGCVLMGLLANYPIALAPGMGHNAFFVFSLAAVMSWQAGLALTMVAGALFMLLSVVGLRSMVLNAIPDSLKSGIAAGIGLFIALIGLQFGNIVVKPAGPVPVAMEDMRHNPAAWVALIGLVLTLVLLRFRVPGALLLGIVLTTGAALGLDAAGVAMPGLQYRGVLAWPSGWTTTAGGFAHGFGELWQGLTGGRTAQLVTLLFVLLFMDLFDTVGTLVGVAQRAGLIEDGRLPRAERALLADASATVVGAALGTSTVTSYIESVTGVSEGARTGLAALAAGGLMLAALFFQPLVSLVGGGVVVGADALGQPLVRYPMLTAALVVVGAMMMRTLRQIDWDDPTEYLPGFLTMAGMAFTYNISHGIAIGFVSYAVGKLLTGRFRQCPAVVYLFAALFVLRYALMPVG